VNRRDLDQGEILELASENDALVAHLYKLSRQQVAQIFGGFHRGWDSSKQDYVDRFERVMKYFDAWVAKA
jgi:hypothetical protein